MFPLVFYIALSSFCQFQSKVAYMSQRNLNNSIPLAVTLQIIDSYMTQADFPLNYVLIVNSDIIVPIYKRNLIRDPSFVSMKYYNKCVTDTLNKKD